MNKNRFICLLGLISILSCTKTDNKCSVDKVKKIFSDVYITSYDTTYVHHVLVEGIIKKCMDSLQMVNLAFNYIDTLTEEKPVSFIKFYNSDKEFYPNEGAQDWQEVDKSCLVGIYFFANSKQIQGFRFYSDEGNLISDRNTWNHKTKN